MCLCYISHYYRYAVVVFVPWWLFFLFPLLLVYIGKRVVVIVTLGFEEAVADVASSGGNGSTSSPFCPGALSMK